MVIHLLDSLMKGTKVLYVDPDEKQAVNIESMAENDSELSRSLFYVANDSEEASNLVRQQNIDICIFPDGLDGHDFVYLQKELISANPNIKLIPLIDKVVTLQQINEFRESSSVISFADNNILGNFELVKNQVLNAVREIRVKHVKDSGQSLEKIQNSLLIDHDDWREIKFRSSMGLHFFIPKFDLSAIERNHIELAESIYFPWVKPNGYSQIMNDDNLLPILQESGSWEGNRSPQSFSGLIVTLVNYAAWNFQKNHHLHQVIDSFEKKSPFLKHKSMRSFNTGLIEQLENAFQSIKQPKVA